MPAGPPSPQLANSSTQTPNGQTLKMNSGDVLVVSITDPLHAQCRVHHEVD